MQEDSKSKGFSFENWLNGLIEEKNEENSVEAEKNPQEKAEIAVEELRNQYSARVRENYDLMAKKLRAERDDALRENWILQQRAEAALPEQMAASGINGGAAETSLAALRAKYQGGRNDIRGNYADSLEELSYKAGNEEAETQRNLNEKWLDYLLSLAKMERQNELEKGFY